ncbi:MAG: DedA family protein [Candidatus Dormibacteria bacterium]
MGQLISNWVSGGGVAVVFVLMLVNSCGLPIPSEVIMPVAGVLAATGHLNVVAVIIGGVAGNVIGACVAYALARRFGHPLLLGPGKHLGLRVHHLEMADRWFARYGLPTVFFGRMLPVVCTYISFPAGLAKVKPVWFVILTFLGAVPWVTGLTLIGYLVGANYDRISGPIGKAAIIIAVLVVLGLVAWFVRGRRTAAAQKAG